MQQKMIRQKLLIKVLVDTELKWIHLCYIDHQLYRKFKSISGYESQTIGSHITRWLLQDFGVKLQMSTKMDVMMLRNILQTWYRHEYPEIYLKCPGDKQRISNLIGIWLTQHMQYEIELYKGGKKHD